MKACEHTTGRYESGQCIGCHRERERTRYATNPEVRAAKRAQARAWKVANPEKKRALDTKYIADARALLQRLKSAPCADCSATFPYYCMDFDHARGDKRFEISKRAGRVCLKTLLAEIRKCDVVCANCHRIRTQRRLGRA